MNAIMTNDQLRRSAPSVFAASPWHAMSDRYGYVPTIEVVDILRDRGFFPVRASQSIARLDDRANFTKHMIRFRHQDFLNAPRIVGTEIPEVVLVNSHDGSSAYQFSVGIFRLVCSNGAVVPTGDMGGISVRHSGGRELRDRVIDTTFQIVEDTPKVLGQIDEWKQLALPAPAQQAYAEAAQELVGNDSFAADRLLWGRRPGDRPDENGNRDLWTTFQAVQENVMKGDIPGRSKSGRRTRTRPVKSVDRDIKLNKALWTLTARMAELAK